VGPLARRVEDLALALGILNGGNDPEREPPMPLGDFRGVDLGNLRVAYYEDDGVFAPAPGARRAVREAAEALRRKGARVAAWTPPEPLAVMRLMGGLLFADQGALMREMLGRDKPMPQITDLMTLARLPRPMLRALGGLLRAVGQSGMAANLGIFGSGDTADYWRAVEAQEAYRDSFRNSLDRDAGGPFDVILCPPHSLPAFRHGASRDLVLAGTYAAMYNVLGYPAGVVPVTRVRADEQEGRRPSRDKVEKAAWSAEQGSVGLPIGVQVVARPWREHVALAAMAAIEAGVG
jgi:fatty acid amide hydrolase